jgi:hypothetical protein
MMDKIESPVKAPYKAVMRELKRLDSDPDFPLSPSIVSEKTKVTKIY